MSLAPLRLCAFRHLLVAYGVNQLGDWAAEVALAVLVYGATRSPAGVATTWVVHRCAFAWLAPVLVTRLERHRVDRTLPTLYLIEGTLFLVLARTAPSLGVAAVLPLVALDGLLAPTARALARATLVSVTRPVGLHRDGNALLNVVFTVNGMLAPALGGIAVATVGAPLALTANAATFVLAAAALGHCRPHLNAAVTPAREPADTKHALRDAVRYVRDRAVLRDLLLVDAAAVLFVSMITPVEVTFVTETLHSGGGGLGAVLSAWGVGMVLGGILAGRLHSASLPTLLLSSCAAQAVACLGMGGSGGIDSVLAFSALGGIGNGGYAMAVVTAIQQRTSDAYQARVNGLYDTLGALAPGIGFAAGGLLATAAGPRPAYMVAGAGALAVVGWATGRLRTTDWSVPCESRTVSPA